jgi:hypothetical protein
MRQFGLSTALGAFVAGVVLAESPYRHELESDVEPFRSILLGLFFLSVGMLLDLRLIAARPLLVVGLAAGVIVTKTLLITALSRVFGCNWKLSLRLGLLLSQAGEFGFVLFAQATAAMLISPTAASLFSAVVTLSMVTTPFLMRFIDYLEKGDVPRPDLDGPELSPETSAIVVGYGRFGQTVAQMMMAKRIVTHRYRSGDRDCRHLWHQGLLWRRDADRPASHGRCRDGQGHPVLPGQPQRRAHPGRWAPSARHRSA